MKNLWSVVMAGGIGERFWPLSTKKDPKQFLPIFGGGIPLLKAAVLRMGNSVPPSRSLIVTNRTYEKASRSLFTKGKQPVVLGEPIGKNTAPAVAAAAAYIERQNPDAVMAIFSADHIISPESLFQKCVLTAAKAAESSDSLFCLGVKPSWANSGLGYIEVKGKVAANSIAVRDVVQFIEKPDTNRAANFIKKGNFLWNCGIFVWSVKSILKAFQTTMPALYLQIEPARKAKTDSEFKRSINDFYIKVQKESIDYGVLEKVDNIKVVNCPIAWDDMGSYTSFKAHSTADKSDNVFIGDIIDLNSTGTMVYSDSGLTVTASLNDLFIIRKKNKLLVMHKSVVPEMRTVINSIKKSGFESYLNK